MTSCAASSAPRRVTSSSNVTTHRLSFVWPPSSPRSIICWASTREKRISMPTSQARPSGLRRFNSRTCPLCGTDYEPTGPAQKFCKPCGVLRKKEKSRERSYDFAVESGRIQNPGVGSGGVQNGSSNPYWKGGISPPYYRQWKKDTCESCGTILHLVGHHKNRNRQNNDRSNIETLCRSCHAVEHQLGQNFKAGKSSGKRESR